jgi:putative spermidine/putrescine transport system substrate-binding protein
MTDISRRLALQVSGGVALALVAHGARAADPTVIDIVSDGDTNVTDWWSNVLNPLFMKAYPGLRLNVVATRASGSNGVVAQRVVAAHKTGTNPQVDYFEEYDPRQLPGGIESGAFMKIDASEIPNFKLVNPLGIESPYVVPYRGSQVLIAYDSARLPEAEAPRTWPALVAWIKANPGQFIHCRPDKGGSGKNFVVRAVHEVNGRNPSLFTPTNFDPDVARKRFAPAWELLRELQPSFYDQAAYPADNNPVLQLLAGGAVTLITAWSDQALQGIAQGVLPPSTKLLQLQDLGLCGGFAFGSIPADAPHLAATKTLVNFILSPAIQERMIADFGAFPGIFWSNLPPELAEKYKGVIATSVPHFPGGAWSAALNEGWYADVAAHHI